jgi:hypothetical protein
MSTERKKVQLAFNDKADDSDIEHIESQIALLQARLDKRTDYVT